MYFIVFANSLDLDQVWQNIEPDLDFNRHSNNIHEKNFENYHF